MKPHARRTVLANTARAGLAVIVIMSTPASLPAVAVESRSFEDRRSAMLEAACAAYEAKPEKPAWSHAFLVAGALFERGKVEEGRRLANFALDGLVPGNTINRWYAGGNSGFAVWPGIDCYIRYEHLLGDELRARFKEIYTSGVFYGRFSTSNHVTMAAVTRYLAVQTWGREAFKPHPDYADKVYESLPRELQKATRFPPSQLFSNDDPDAVAYVRGLVEHVIRNGPGEYASRPYGCQNTLPLLTLADCAKDPELRQRARIAYELTLVQLAPAWQRGHLATFAPRSYPDLETQQPRGIAALAWLYFGGVPPREHGHQWPLLAAISGYRMPDVALAAGTDRSRSYRHRALFSGWALDHHVTPTYALFARSPKHALAKKARYPFQGQSYPCGIMWDEPDVSRCSHLWITCPAADDNSSSKNCPSGLHTHGVSQHEQEVLHENSLLWTFRIPADYRNPYVLGFIPGGARAAINDAAQDGRIFLHYGSVLVGIAASEKFAWDPAAGIRAPAGKLSPGCSEFRIPCSTAAVALEAAPPAEFGGGTPEEQLARFRGRLRATTKIACRSGEKPVGEYVDRGDNRLECGFDGEDRVNGVAIDYLAWPVLDNPWMKQVAGESLVLTDGATERSYDFSTWTVDERPAGEQSKGEEKRPAREERPAADATGGRVAELLTRCLEKRPRDEHFAKEAMVFHVARLHAGRDEDAAVAGWLASAERANQTANPEPPAAIPDPFNKHALVYAWMLGGSSSLLPADAAGRIAAATKEYVCRYGHRTWRGYGALNYRLLSDGAAFIAAEQWPDLRDADGLDSAGIRAATRKRLLAAFDDMVRRNSSEYGAPTYQGVNLSALKLLADHARDETVRGRAELTLDAMLVHLACGWHRGYHVSPASRAKGFGTAMTGPDSMDATAAIGWLYFGAERPVAGLCEHHSGWFALPGRYLPPPLIAAIAADRATPFTHLGSRGSRIRFTIHHEPAYALASEWTLLETPRDAHFKESRRQMLKWVSDRPHSTFMPFQENPRRPYRLEEGVANAFGYGENPYAQSLQHHRTLIGVSAVPADYPYWRIEAPFSTTGSIVARSERDGWICCHAGSMLFAFWLGDDPRWAARRKAERCDVLVSEARRTGWVLETSPLEPFAGGGVQAELERFAAAIAARTRIDAVGLSAERPRLVFTSLDGHVLDLTYRPHGEAPARQQLVDGVPVAYDTFPLLGNPWVRQALGAPCLVLSHGGETLRYDFERWTRNPSRE